MNGKILDYNTSTKVGVILAIDNGERYTFNIDNWNTNNIPQKNMQVDFICEGNVAKDVFMLKDTQSESNTLFGLLSVGLTFFFLFIGTFVSRLFIAKEPIGKVILPTLIHFITTVLIIIPFFGWMITLIATLYYMYKNYKLIVENNNL